MVKRWGKQRQTSLSWAPKSLQTVTAAMKLEDTSVQWLSHVSLFVTPWDFPGKSSGVGCHCLLPNYLLLMGNCMPIFWFLSSQNMQVVFSLSSGTLRLVCINLCWLHSRSICCMGHPLLSFHTVTFSYCWDEMLGWHHQRDGHEF